MRLALSALSYCANSVHYVAGIFGHAYYFVVLLGAYVVEIIVYGVLGSATVADFVVEVRAGGLAGVSYEAYEVAALHFLPYLCYELRHVGVARGVVVAVVYLHHVAVCALP